MCQLSLMSISVKVKHVLLVVKVFKLLRHFVLSEERNRLCFLVFVNFLSVTKLMLTSYKYVVTLIIFINGEIRHKYMRYLQRSRLRIYEPL